MGPGADDATDHQVREAELVGLGLARAGVPVICGGLFGVMDGVARGVRAGGGDVTGVVPGADVLIANPALTHVIAACGAGEMRNQVIVVSSAALVVALVVVGMNPGTAMEVLMAVSRKLGKPAFGVNVDVLCGSHRLDSMTLPRDVDGDPAWSQAVRAATAVALGEHRPRSAD
ncbi:MAG: hypothetical protein PGN11_09385 [Quadrisphaera sp.]